MTRSFYNSPWLLVLCCVLSLSALRLQAATRTITDTNESVLRAAIAQAASGDTIRLDFTAPIIVTNIEVIDETTSVTNFTTNYWTTISLTNGQLVINKDLTIIGVGATNGTLYPAIDGQLLSRILQIQSGNVILQNLTLLNGNATNNSPFHGGAISSLGSLTISNCAFVANHCFPDMTIAANGGAIFSQGTLAVYNCGFTNNECSGSGAGICNAGTATIKGSTFVDGYAWRKGGGVVNFGNLTLFGSTLYNNRSVSLGGAGFANNSNAVATICNSHFDSNTNTYYGGGGIINAGTMFVTNSTFADNVSDKDSSVNGLSGGGAIFNDSGTANLSACVIGPTNTAIRGGGVLNCATVPSAPAVLVLNGCTICNNYASRFGGGG